MGNAGIIALALLATAPGVARADEAPAPPDPVAEARAEQLPTDLLEAKEREAALKHVPAERARPVLEGLLANLREANGLVSDVSPGPARGPLVSAVAQALAAGAPASAISTTLAATKNPAERRQAALALAALANAGVPAAAAARLVQAAVRNHLADRLPGLRPALEAMERSGYGRDEAVDDLARGMARGRAPLDVADDEIRGAADHGNGRGGHSAASAGGEAPDRDHSDRSNVGGRGANNGGGNGGNGGGNNGNGGGNNGNGNGNGHGNGKP